MLVLEGSHLDSASYCFLSILPQPEWLLDSISVCSPGCIFYVWQPFGEEKPNMLLTVQLQKNMKDSPQSVIRLSSLISRTRSEKEYRCVVSHSVQRKRISTIKGRKKAVNGQAASLLNVTVEGLYAVFHCPLKWSWDIIRIKICQNCQLVKTKRVVLSISAWFPHCWLVAFSEDIIIIQFKDKVNSLSANTQRI